MTRLTTRTVALFMRTPDRHEFNKSQAPLSAKEKALDEKLRKWSKGGMLTRKEAKRVVDAGRIGILRRIFIMTPRAHTPIDKYRKSERAGGDGSGSGSGSGPGASQDSTSSINENHAAAHEYYDYDSDLDAEEVGEADGMGES